jgi:hypothetical protein
MRLIAPLYAAEASAEDNDCISWEKRNPFVRFRVVASIVSGPCSLIGVDPFRSLIFLANKKELLALDFGSQSRIARLKSGPLLDCPAALPILKVASRL